jgi:hypothetical protein
MRTPCDAAANQPSKKKDLHMAATAFQTQYRQEFIAGFEEKQSLLRSAVTTESVVKGMRRAFYCDGCCNHPPRWRIAWQAPLASHRLRAFPRQAGAEGEAREAEAETAHALSA